MFMEAWILWVSCKVNVKPEGFINFARDPKYSWSINIPQIEFIQS